MNKLVKEFRKAMRDISQEIKITNSNKLKKKLAHMIYAYAIYNIEQSKRYLRASAHAIQKYYGPNDKKNKRLIRILKKDARGSFRSLQKQLNRLDELSDLMDNRVFSLED